MLNLKNNENDGVFDEICKRKKRKLKKMKGTLLVEESLTAIDI